MYKHLILLVSILTVALSAGSAFAQVAITQNQMTYAQSFDGLPGSNTNWNDNSTIPHWYAARTGYAMGQSFPMRVGNGSSGSTYLYSFRTSNPGANRALGSVGPGGTHYAWGVRCKNLTGQTLQSVTVRYYLEQWRRTSSANEQPLRFSYLVSANPITGITPNEAGYTKVPFLNAISPVTTEGSHSSLDGDAPANRVLVSHTFRITLQPNEEIMLKWYDEDDSKIDHGLAIDDLELQFYTHAPSIDVCDGAVSFRQFMKGVILDIPDEDSGIDYPLPSPLQRLVWETALQQIMAGQYAQADTTLSTEGIDYRVTAMANGGDTLYVVANNGNTGNCWGTYVFHPNAARSCLVLQAPHPLNDAMTGEQASYLYDELDAFLLMVAGAHRCLSAEPSGCSGSSTVCRPDGQFVNSDLAHVVESMFQVTTEVVADTDTSTRFVQLHGFSKSQNEPYFVISNGTRQTPSPDYVVALGDYLTTVPVNDITPPPPGALTYEAPHINLNYSGNIGTTNVQGRYINLYDKGDICTSNATSTSVTGRFLHLEQYYDMRKYPANYPILRDALLASGIGDCGLKAGLTSVLPPISNAPESAHALRVQYGVGGASAVLESPLPEVRLVLLSTMGQVLSEQTVQVHGRAVVQLATAGLPKGLYLLSAGFGPERQTVRLLVW